MARLTTTSYVILSSLTTSERSAYELAEQVGRGLADLWFGETRQRYEAPKRLVELGLITGRTEPGDGSRTRTVYAITDAGREALAAWLAEPPRPLSIRFEGMVRVLAMEQGSIEDLHQNLETIAAQAQEAYDRNAEMAARLFATGGACPQRLHSLALTIRFLSQHFAAILDWTEWALDEIATWDDPVAPGTTHLDRSLAILEQTVADQQSRRSRQVPR